MTTDADAVRDVLARYRALCRARDVERLDEAMDLFAPGGSRRALTLTAALVRRNGAWLFHTTHWALAAE